MCEMSAVYSALMRKVADSSSSPPTPQDLQAHGYEGHIRYLSHQPSKNWTAAQIAAHHAAGLPIAVVWETTANRALAGTQAGSEDAREANRQADALNWPKDRPIYYAVDVETSPQSVIPYFQGVSDTLGRPVGIYGSYPMIEFFVRPPWVISWGWQAAAWSGIVDNRHVFPGSGGISVDGRRLSAHACLYQCAGVGDTMGGRVDCNIVLKDDWGQWSPNYIPKPKDPSMHRLLITDIRKGDPGPSWLIEGGFKRWLPESAYYDILSKAPADSDILVVGNVGDGHWATALLDLATLLAPEATPKDLGGLK